MSFVDLASERFGGRVLVANDEFFAEKENLLKPDAPVFAAGRDDDRGQGLEGGEWRRRREPGDGWGIGRLGLPGRSHAITVDTSHFLANFPEACSVEACAAPEDSDAGALADSDAWTEILTRTPLEGNAENRFEIEAAERLTHVRLRIYPDGGVARLRVWGRVLPDWERLSKTQEAIDLVAVQHGGRPVACSNEFYGGTLNLIRPDRSKTMADGWETGRRRGPGHDWVILQLGRPGVVESVEVDTAFFKGNFPDSCSLEGCETEDEEALSRGEVSWFPLLPQVKLMPDHRHVFNEGLAPHSRVTHVRVYIYPDPGASRLRLCGTLS